MVIGINYVVKVKARTFVGNGDRDETVGGWRE